MNIKEFVAPPHPEVANPDVGNSNKPGTDLPPIKTIHAVKCFCPLISHFTGGIATSDCTCVTTPKTYSFMRHH